LEPGSFERAVTRYSPACGISSLPHSVSDRPSVLMALEIAFSDLIVSSRRAVTLIPSGASSELFSGSVTRSS
jgi:hypothetical protein